MGNKKPELKRLLYLKNNKYNPPPRVQCHPENVFVYYIAPALSESYFSTQTIMIQHN